MATKPRRDPASLLAGIDLADLSTPALERIETMADIAADYAAEHDDCADAESFRATADECRLERAARESRLTLQRRAQHVLPLAVAR